jgi:hypothetical protein
MSSDPISSVAKGATKGALEWSEAKISLLISKFNDRELAFIRDLETINTAKEVRTKGEFAAFKGYVTDKDSRVLFQMGLTLRKLDAECKEEQRRQLCERIVNKYDIDGLHFAYFVQNGSFSTFLGNILGKNINEERVTKEIQYLISNIEKVTIYIKSSDRGKKDRIITEINAKIYANKPENFIISAGGDAREMCQEIFEIIYNDFQDEYDYEKVERNSILTFFLNKKINYP